MAKSLWDVLVNTRKEFHPRGPQERRFFDMHRDEDHKLSEPTKNDAQFQASNVKTYDRSKDRMGRDVGDSQEVEFPWRLKEDMTCKCTDDDKKDDKKDDGKDDDKKGKKKFPDFLKKKKVDEEAIAEGYDNIDMNLRGRGLHVGYGGGHVWRIKKSNGPKSDWYAAHSNAGHVITGQGLKEISQKIGNFKAPPIKEELLGERIFGPEKYEYWKLGKKAHDFDYRGKTHTIHRGDVFGIRKATSQKNVDGSNLYRVVIPHLGTNYVHSISHGDAAHLSTRSGPATKSEVQKAYGGVRESLGEDKENFGKGTKTHDVAAVKRRRDLALGKQWYNRLSGRPSVVPNSGWTKQDMRGYMESREQIDELSPAKLTSYIGKASQDAVEKAAQANRPLKMRYQSARSVERGVNQDKLRRANNRLIGIKDAARKLEFKIATRNEDINEAGTEYRYGHELHPDDQKRVLAAYVHRYTGEHKPDWANKPRPNGKAYNVQFKDDNEWLHNTKFGVKKNGRLSSKTRFAQSNPTWPEGKE